MKCVIDENTLVMVRPDVLRGNDPIIVGINESAGKAGHIVAEMGNGLESRSTNRRLAATAEAAY